MKKIKIITILLTLTFVFTACGKKTPVIEIDNNKQKTEEAKKEKENSQDKQDQIKISPEILETDIDISDWAMYKSEKYGYSIKLPKRLIFVDEYHGEKIEFDPNQESFILSDSTIKDNRYLYNLYFSIKQENISDFIERYNRESGQTDAITKLFSRDSMDYYYNQGKHTTNTFIPTIINSDTIIISLSRETEFNIEEFKKIINTVIIKEQ